MNSGGNSIWLVAFLAVIAPLGAILVAVLVPRVQRQADTAKWFRDNRLSSYLALIDCVTEIRLAQTQLNRTPLPDRVEARRVVYSAYLEIQKAAYRVQMLGPKDIASCAAAIITKSWEWTSFVYREDPPDNYGEEGKALNLQLKELETRFLDLTQSDLSAGR